MHLSGTHISRFVANWKASVFLWLFITHFYFQWQLIYLVLFVSYCYHINISFNFEFFFTSRIFIFFFIRGLGLLFEIHSTLYFHIFKIIFTFKGTCNIFFVQYWASICICLWLWWPKRCVSQYQRICREYCSLMSPIVVLRNSSSCLQWSYISWGRWLRPTGILSKAHS